MSSTAITDRAERKYLLREGYALGAAVTLTIQMYSRLGAHIFAAVLLLAWAWSLLRGPSDDGSIPTGGES